MADFLNQLRVLGMPFPTRRFTAVTLLALLIVGSSPTIVIAENASNPLAKVKNTDDPLDGANQVAPGDERVPPIQS